MAELITRKDGGSKGGAVHKAHMSYYNHMRRMKKKHRSMSICGETDIENDLSDINSDLECVLQEPIVQKKNNRAPRKRMQ